VENKFLIHPSLSNDDRVASVVSALIPRDQIEMGSEQIDDLAFTLISPLCANDCKVHEFFKS
jgi:hypothetical protein